MEAEYIPCHRWVSVQGCGPSVILSDQGMGRYLWDHRLVEIYLSLGNEHSMFISLFKGVFQTILRCHVWILWVPAIYFSANKKVGAYKTLIGSEGCSLEQSLGVQRWGIPQSCHFNGKHMMRISWNWGAHVLKSVRQNPSRLVLVDPQRCRSPVVPVSQCQSLHVSPTNLLGRLFGLKWSQEANKLPMARCRCYM